MYNPMGLHEEKPLKTLVMVDKAESGLKNYVSP